MITLLARQCVQPPRTFPRSRDKLIVVDQSVTNEELINKLYNLCYIYIYISCFELYDLYVVNDEGEEVSEEYLS